MSRKLGRGRLDSDVRRRVGDGDDEIAKLTHEMEPTKLNYDMRRHIEYETGKRPPKAVFVCSHCGEVGFFKHKKKMEEETCPKRQP